MSTRESACLPEVLHAGSGRAVEQRAGRSQGLSRMTPEYFSRYVLIASGTCHQAQFPSVPASQSVLPNQTCHGLSSFPVDPRILALHLLLPSHSLEEVQSRYRLYEVHRNQKM